MNSALGAIVVGGAIAIGIGSWLTMITLGFISHEFGLLAPLGYPMSTALFALLLGLRIVFGISITKEG